MIYILKCYNLRKYFNKNITRMYIWRIRKHGFNWMVKRIFFHILLKLFQLSIKLSILLRAQIPQIIPAKHCKFLIDVPACPVLQHVTPRDSEDYAAAELRDGASF